MSGLHQTSPSSGRNTLRMSGPSSLSRDGICCSGGLEYENRNDFVPPSSERKGLISA